MTEYKPPFPWFGGKRLIASEIWRALGDVDNYVEPFAGSLAALFCRPETHAGHIETVNDYDMYIANFWRAVKGDPEQVAYYANNPVNEADLTARHIWLVNTGRERIARIQGDPDYYDAKVAGWWVWGICCWIGSGWCAGTGPWSADANGQLVNLSAGQGVNRQLVHLGNAGRGVNRQLVHLGNAGQGVNRQRGESAGIDTGLDDMIEYMQRLSARLRYVRVCCGDWARVVTDGALAHGSTIGVFLDPPYDTSMRDDGLYNTDADDQGVSASAREWCIVNGSNPRYRIVLAGYDGEHNMPDDWRVVSWSAGASYQRSNSSGGNKDNRHKELLWLSPGCVERQRQYEMFGDAQ